MKVTFYRNNVSTCGDGCCSILDDTEIVAIRELTDEQFAKLKWEVGDGLMSPFYDTEDFVEGESESFSFFTVDN